MADEAKNDASLRVLLVEDEASLRGPLAKHLEREYGYAVIQAAHAEEARRLFSQAERSYDVALVDDLLAPSAGEEPEYLGIALLREIKDRWRETEVIIFTGWGMERALEALRAGAYRYLEKPVDPGELGVTIQMAAEQARLRRERDLLSAALEIGNAMVSVADASRALAVIAEAVPRLTGADSFAVGLFDSLTGKVRHEPVAHVGDAAVRWTRHLRREHLTRQIVEAGKPFYVADVDARADELDRDLVKSGVKSFVGAPIPAGARRIGVLYAYSLRPEAFGLHEHQVLTLLAQQAGIALQNAQLLDATRRASSELAALNEVVLEIGEEVDRSALLRKVIARAVALLTAKGGGIYLLSRSGESLTLEAAVGLSLDLGLQIGVDEGLSGEILRTNEPQQVTDYCRWRKRLRVLDSQRLASVAGAPVRVGERTLGTLVVHDTRPERRFDESALALLQQLANHAGLALQKAELLDKLRGIQRVSTVIASSLDQSRVLDLTCKAAVELFGVDHSGLVLFDKDLQWGRVEGEYPRRLKATGKRLPVAGVPAEERLACEGEVLLFPDVEQAASELGPVLEIWRKLDIRSILIVPIVYRDRVLGSFSLDAVGRMREFAQEEIELLKAFAAHVAVAVENARLFSEQSETKEHLDALIGSSSDAVIAIDQDEMITVFNRRAEEMFGWTADELTGKTVWPLYADVEKAREVFEVVSRGLAIDGWDVELMHRDGTLIPALVSATLIRDSQGRPIGQAGFMRDLRDVRALEDRLRALIGVSRAISGTLELDEVLSLVVESAVAAFPGAQGGAIHLYDEKADLLRVQAETTGYSDEALETLNLAVGEGIAGWVFQNRQPVVVPDALQDPQYRRVDHPEVRPDRAIMCVPLRVKDQVIGTLSVSNKVAGEVFESEDLGLVFSFADQAAIAIDNAQRMQKLEQLRQAAEGLSGITGVKEVLREVVKSAREILEADSAIVWSYDDGRRTFLPDEVVADGIEIELVDKFREDELQAGGTADIVMQRGYLAVADVDDSDYAFLGSTAHGLRGEIRARAFQGITLKAGTERLGVLYLNYDGVRTFTEDEEATLRTFASHAALALKNARLLEQVRSARDAAKVVAEASVLEELEQTLDSIVEGTRDVLGCDAVCLYTYDHAADRLGHPPTLTGVWYPERATRMPEVPRESIVYRMLRLDEPYIADSTTADPLFKNLRFVQDEQIESCVVVPLKVRDRRAGVMFVNYRSRHRFTREELTNIELFSHQAAVAIRNAQLYDETTRRASALQALYKASRAVAGTLALEEILSRIVEQAWRLAEPRGKKTHFSHLALADGNRLTFAAGHPPGTLDRLRAKTPEIDLEGPGRIGITGRVAVTCESQLVGDVLGDPDYIDTDPNVRSQLGVPVQLGSRVVGVISVEHPEPNAFDKEDQRVLESLAAQAAIAIENARLYERQQREVRELALINQIAAEISASLDLEKILGTLVAELARVMGVEQCAIAIFDEQGEYGDVVAEHLEEGCVPSAGMRIPLRDNPSVELVRQTRKPLAVRDAQHDPRMREVWDIMKRRRTQSIMIVPIVIGGEVIGTVGVDAVSGPRDFSMPEQKLAETIAYHAAIAIQNARRYEELKRTKGLVGARTALAWMGMASSAWRHSIDKHALTIREQAQLLRKDLHAFLAPEACAKPDGRLGVIEDVAARILQKPIVPPLSVEEGVAPITVDDLIGERAKQLWQNEPYRRAELRLDLNSGRQTTVRASPEWLRRAFDVLVDNAADAVADRPVRMITISTREAGGHVEIAVADTGSGIPEELLPKLGLEPIRKPEGDRGLGMGLLMAQTIVQTFGGEIQIGSTGSSGTTALIRLPRA